MPKNATPTSSTSSTGQQLDIIALVNLEAVIDHTATPASADTGAAPARGEISARAGISQTPTSTDTSSAQDTAADPDTDEIITLYQQLDNRAQSVFVALVYVLADRRADYTRPIVNGLSAQQLDMAAIVKALSADERAGKYAEFVTYVTAQLAAAGVTLDALRVPPMPYRYQLDQQ